MFQICHGAKMSGLPARFRAQASNKRPTVFTAPASTRYKTLPYIKKLYIYIYLGLPLLPLSQSVPCAPQDLVQIYNPSDLVLGSSIVNIIQGRQGMISQVLLIDIYPRLHGTTKILSKVYYTSSHLLFMFCRGHNVFVFLLFNPKC